MNRPSHITRQAPRALKTWRDLANCAGLKADEWDRTFFPTDGSVTPEAKILCSTCPVIKECDDYANGMQVRDGIWAGKNRQKAGQR